MGLLILSGADWLHTANLQRLVVKYTVQRRWNGDEKRMKMMKTMDNYTHAVLV